MLRWLLRLLIVGLILATIGFVVSRLMGQDDDFDDFDDLDEGFEFEETPVEIDVPADDASTAGGNATATADVEGTGTVDLTKLQNINGIGPAYEARLQAMGIESVDDLISADPTSLAEQLGVIGGQAAVEDWISQARQLTGEGGTGESNGSQENASNA